MLLLRLGLAYAAAVLSPVPWGLLGAMCAAARRRRPHVDRAALPIVLAAGLLGTLDHAAPSEMLPSPGCRARTEGWIASPPERSGRVSRALLQIESLACGGRPAACRIRVQIRARQQLPPYGTRVRAHGRLRPPHPQRHFHTGGEAAFLVAQGACAVLEADSLVVIRGARGPAWRRATVEPLRRRLAQAIDAALAPREAGLLSALVLGIRTDVQAEVDTAWRALGLTHILSISGMHVGLLAVALLALFGSPRRPRGFLGLVAGVWIYSALGGLGPTVLRASLMTTWAAAAMALGRTVRPLAGLATAAAILVLPTPHRRFDLGLQLSCAATAGLLCAAPVLARWSTGWARRNLASRAAAWALAGAGIGVAAQMATLPLTLAHFGSFAWIAPLANLVFVPLTDAALVLGLVGAPLSLASEALGRPLLLASGGLLWAALEASLEAARAVPQLFLAPTRAALTAASVAAAATLALPLCAVARRRLAWACGGAAVVALAVLGILALRPSRPAWQVEMLDVGQGDAVVLGLGGETWLVDAGDAAPFDRGARVVVPHLRRQGVRRLRGVVLTHPHRDHIGGAASVLQALHVDTLYVAAISSGDSAYVRLRRLLPHVPVRPLARGDRLTLARGGTARVLWPDSSSTAALDCNDRSLVLWATVPGAPDLLLTGDLEEPGEHLLLERQAADLAPLAARFVVLKAAHHGSATSSREPFLDRIRPDVALVSAGERNRYGHPAASTLEALRRRDCVVLRTDRGGAVRLVLRGSSLWLERPAVPPVLVQPGGPG